MYSYVFLLCATLSFAVKRELPSYIRPCRLSDENINNCIAENANNAIPELVKGDKEYKVVTLQPYSLSRIIFNSDTSLNMTLSDIVVYNAEHLRVISTNFNKNENTFRLHFYLDNMPIEGDYILDGKILILPIKGQGKINITLVDGNYAYKAYLKMVEKNGESYYNIEKSDLDANFSKAYFHFTNLFQGDKKLGEEMNKFINDNWREFLKEMQPVGVKVLSEIIDNTINAYFSVVPKKILFTP